MVLKKQVNWVSAGKEAGVAGRFGEAFIAQLLAKKGVVDVVEASGEGFDLFAITKRSSLIKKNTLVGISVKARKNYNGIPLRYPAVQRAAKTWHAEPWIGIVISNATEPPDAYMLPLKVAITISHKGNTKRGKDYLLSGSRLSNGDFERYHLTSYAAKEMRASRRSVGAQLAWKRHRKSLLAGAQKRRNRE